MKNLIITTGALILMLTIMSFQFQCNELMREKKQLKFAADEACATAALCYISESFGEGKLIFDKKKAEKKASEMVSLNLKVKASMKIEFFEEDGCPSVKITLKTDRISETSIYEYVIY